jgi:hypothetical protein
MKTIIILILLLGWLPISTLGNAENQKVGATAEKTEVLVPGQVRSFLMMKLGLSSTGTIKVIGKYHLTDDCKLGKKSDEVLHVIQQDLFGDRLFWSCLVNLTQERIINNLPSVNLGSEDFVEFLYINRPDCGWNCGPNGMINAAFLRGEARFILESSSNRKCCQRSKSS